MHYFKADNYALDKFLDLFDPFACAADGQFNLARWKTLAQACDLHAWERLEAGLV